MAGGFGYTVQAPMEVPQQVLYSPYSTGRPGDGRVARHY